MNLSKRLFQYFFGFLIMTFGVALSVKSNLGVSPISSIPYTMTCIIGLEMGKATIIFHALLVVFQIVILRKDFLIRLLLVIVSTFFIAYGLHLYVPANFIPLAGEGAMLAIAEKFHFKFPSVKLAFDISMVVISLITCLIFLRTPASVGIGTVIAAVSVGVELKWIKKIAK